MLFYWLSVMFFIIFISGLIGAIILAKNGDQEGVWNSGAVYCCCVWYRSCWNKNLLRDCEDVVFERGEEIMVGHCSGYRWRQLMGLPDWAGTMARNGRMFRFGKGGRYFDRQLW
jgi:hypothetical protein